MNRSDVFLSVPPSSLEVLTDTVSTLSRSQIQQLIEGNSVQPEITAQDDGHHSVVLFY